MITLQLENKTTADRRGDRGARLAAERSRPAETRSRGAERESDGVADIDSIIGAAPSRSASEAGTGRVTYARILAIVARPPTSGHRLAA